MDELAEILKEFALVSCLTGTMTHCVWFVNSGASSHMTGYCDLLTNMAKEHRDLHVELGYNAKHSMEGIGSIQLQLDSRIPMEMTEVLYIPRSK